tara:strand:+ start:658 stop:1338 length:681 start_codon:yes stop_codon:yes gene_type:complete
LVRYWDPNDSASDPGSGTTISDISGQSKDLTLLNGVGRDDDEAKWWTMDGSNDRLRAANLGWNEDQAWTICIWVQFDQFDRGMLAGVGHTTNSYGIDILVGKTNASGQVRGGVRGGTGSLRSVTNTSNLFSGNWYHVAVTHSPNAGGFLKVYIDGSLDGTTNFTVNVPSLSTSEYFYVGATQCLGGSSSGTDEIDGNIGTIACYTRTLSATEVNDNFEYYEESYQA